MIKARAWPVRAMYILIAAALAISLFITAAPAQKVSGANDDDVAAEWTRVETPTLDGWVLAPDSRIIDYALASDGEVAYAVVEAYNETWADYDFRLLKSDDYAATWTDITDALEDALDITDDQVVNDDSIEELMRVATDWEDPDFVAVALEMYDFSDTTYEVHVLISADGGETFTDADEVEDGVYFPAAAAWRVSDLVVSPEVDGDRDIAISGQENGLRSALFRCTVTGDSAGAWHDATAYDGWDDDGIAFNSTLVTDILFSPNWAEDKTILAVSVTNSTTPYAYGDVHLQTGAFGKTGGAWNAAGDFPAAVLVKDNVEIPMCLAWYSGYSLDARGIAGVAVPLDYYEDLNPDMRWSWVWVNYYTIATGSVGEILRVRNDAVDAVDTQITGMPWLTNVAYLGYKAEGKAIAGVLTASKPGGQILPTDSNFLKGCGLGVDVFRNGDIANMEICCLEWEKACKPPTGRLAMAVSYVSNDPATSKAYAVALQNDFSMLGDYYDEGAWSVSFDDGDTWNQLSLIDTYIGYLSDVAVSPDCNKMMLVSINDYEGAECRSDSVWLKATNLPEAEEYSGQWLRTWSGPLEADDWGLLRLAPEETTGDTVYLVDYHGSTIYYNDLEGLACWQKKSTSATGITSIVDLALADEATLFVLDEDGDVAMSADHGASLTWTDPVDSEVEEGHTIAVWTNNLTHVLVGGYDGEVSYSDDGGETFALLDEPTPTAGYVTVAFDTYYNTNNVIYAAVDGDTSPTTTGGIYMWIIGESEEWTDLNAWHGVAYTGIVLDRPSPANPMTSPETGGVLYASFVGWNGTSQCGKTGVARCLTPIFEVCCDVGATEWDYLMESNPEGLFSNCAGDYVDFEAWPDALKICGCLSADSNSKLFALDDGWDYDMVDYEDGSVWTFEDCYAKKAPDITSPVDGFVVPTTTCECCNAPFVAKWDRLCDACCYEIEFALDEDFTEIYEPQPLDAQVDGVNYAWYCPITPLNPSAWIGCYFMPETTYYWRVRSVKAETDQEIHSWWSEPLSFTVAPEAEAAAITLVSPAPGALEQPTKNVGFSWKLLAAADAFDWVLSKNADLSAPVQTKTGLTGTATTYSGTLDYGTTYYWHVTAYKEGAAISTSAIGTFTTAAQGPFCCPQDGLCFATAPELQAHNTAQHPAQPATPIWVWVVIAIGAVLVIVVIVLIFRTRRV